MTERPIIFSGSMIQAILAGKKTQTRRVVKGFALELLRPNGFTPEFVADRKKGFCPYGHAGDRLWVKETFCDDFIEFRGCPEYRADGEFDADMFDAGCKWRPSIYMPRSLSRITLEITKVRIERLQDISDADADAEGAEPILVPPDGGSRPHVEGFIELWESICGPGSWQANPWVWVIEFERIK